MTGLPKAYPLPAETWSGPDENPVPVRRRVTSILGFVAYCVAAAVVSIMFPAAVPWLLGAIGVVALVQVTVAVTRSVRRRRAARAQVG